MLVLSLPDSTGVTEGLCSGRDRRLGGETGASRLEIIGILPLSAG